MKKATSKLLLFFFCMSFLMVIPKKVNAAEIIPVNISVKYGQTEGRKIFDMINEMRTDSFDAWCWNEDNETKTRYDNLNELAYDYDLERIATKRAAELALLFDHGRPNGESFFSIYEEEGITYRAAGENIAMGYRTAEAVNAAWREDGEPYNGQGHRRNMLNPKFNCVGIGHVYLDGCHYWVEEFAYRTSVNTTETTANDSEQTMSLSVPKSKVTGFKATFDKTSYTLRAGESTEANLTKTMITVSGQWPAGVDRIVTDTPTISVANASIASYNNGKISGLAEGTTTLTASLYGLTAANMPTVSVHESGDKDNTDKDQKETETKDSDKDQKETEVKDQDKNQQQTETPNTKPNQDQNQKPQTVKKTTKKIKLNRKKLILKKGKTFKLKVTLTPKDSKDKIVYRTSNRKIATVSKTGKIKAKKKGKVKITVISGKKKAVCTVKVK